MQKMIEAIRNPKRVALFLLRKFSGCFSDELYLKILFQLQMGYPLNLQSPQTFSEKLQWLKLYNRKPEYTQMVDKYAVKEYVAKLIGEEYIIPTLGVWDRVEDIDFESLPDQFVLKTTHGGGGGGVVVCKDKSNFDYKAAKIKLQQSMNSDIYHNFREWPYKDVKKRIIAERYIEDSQGACNDYKFSCYRGEVTDVMVCLDRTKGDTKFYFFSSAWQLLRYNKRGLEAPADFILPPPKNYEQMFKIASTLSKELPYARIDLYNIDGRIYFGEITFYPASGLDVNLLPETELLFGSRINLKAV